MFEYVFGFVSLLILGFFAGYGRSKVMLVLIAAAYATSWLVGGKAVDFCRLLLIVVSQHVFPVRASSKPLRPPLKNFVSIRATCRCSSIANLAAAASLAGPVYRGYCGYRHNGKVSVTAPFASSFSAVKVAGAIPFVTHWSKRLQEVGLVRSYSTSAVIDPGRHVEPS